MSMTDQNTKNVLITPNNLPMINSDGTYILRYRITSLNGTSVSPWSKRYTITPNLIPGGINSIILNSSSNGTAVSLSWTAPNNLNMAYDVFVKWSNDNITYGDYQYYSTVTSNSCYVQIPNSGTNNAPKYLAVYIQFATLNKILNYFNIASATIANVAGQSYSAVITATPAITLNDGQILVGVNGTGSLGTGTVKVVGYTSTAASTINITSQNPITAGNITNLAIPSSSVTSGTIYSVSQNGSTYSAKITVDGPTGTNILPGQTVVSTTTNGDTGSLGSGVVVVSSISFDISRPGTPGLSMNVTSNGSMTAGFIANIQGLISSVATIGSVAITGPFNATLTTNSPAIYTAVSNTISSSNVNNVGSFGVGTVSVVSINTGLSNYSVNITSPSSMTNGNVYNVTSNINNIKLLEKTGISTIFTLDSGALG
jgi:hypothetical protein